MLSKLLKKLICFFFLFGAIELSGHEKGLIHDPSVRMQFVENKGQWEDFILAEAEIPDGRLFFEKDKLSFLLYSSEDLVKVREQKHQREVAPEDLTVNGHVYRMHFLGASEDVQIRFSGQSRDYINYYLGEEEQDWTPYVRKYDEILYEGLYPGIDLRFYSQDGHFKYDFILSAGADPEDIQIRYEGLDELSVNGEELELKTSVRTVREAIPYAFQLINGAEVALPTSFSLSGDTLHFDVGKQYDPQYPLTIDPVLIFGSYSGSTADNWGYTATYDNSGHLYGGGIVFGAGYPTTTGAFQTSFAGGSPFLGCDIAISKFSPDGTTLLYSTYLGGSNNEFPHSIIVNDNDELFVYGTTGSSDYPIVAGAFDNSFNGGSNVIVTAIEFIAGSDMFISRFNADGSNLLASTYIGGSQNDGFNIDGNLHFNYGGHARGEIILDDAGNCYVASSTYSTDFPTTAGVFQPALNGGQEGCLFKMDGNLTTLLWSTFIGGSQGDGAYSLNIDNSGNILATGGTRSSNFPVSPGSWNDSFLGSTDGWVAKLTPDASSLIAGTFVGTPTYDQSYFIQSDEEDDVYITGQSRGAYPVTGGVYTNPGSAQFITKLNAALTGPIYSTVFGSGSNTPNISPTAFLVDVCENVYVSGWGGITNTGFNPLTGFTNGLPLTADAYQSSTDGSDFYFFVLEKNALGLNYASYFGGNISNEHVDGGTSRFDRNGIVYQAVCAGCGSNDDFPTTPGAWSNTNNSSNCNLGVMKFEFELSGVYAESNALPAISGCVPFTVDFENTSTGAIEYVWDFGDGDTSSLFEPIHTFDSIGTFEVSLIAIDSNSCNIADTSFLTIVVANDSVDAAFNINEMQSCDSLMVELTNTTVEIGPTTYLWDMGDGSSFTTADLSYVYTDTGTYTITLIAIDSSTCNIRDTLSVEVSFSYDFSSGFSSTFDGCTPVFVSFTNDYSGAEDYSWDFGDSSTASGENPTHVYNSPGSYEVTLLTTDCGFTDTVVQTLVIEGEPVAFFNNEPATAIINTPVEFSNESSGASSYEWDFGDGGSSTDENPVHTFTETGNYEVCLTAINSQGCPDTYCRLIEIVFDGIIDVPSAFSPNGDGANDILFVRGYGLGRMNFRVFNRWGELVFETDDITEGWDGTFRSKPQEMDVYIYLLEGEFADGREFSKQGNVTLLR